MRIIKLNWMCCVSFVLLQHAAPLPSPASRLRNVLSEPIHLHHAAPAAHRRLVVWVLLSVTASYCVGNHKLFPFKESRNKCSAVRVASHNCCCCVFCLLERFYWIKLMYFLSFCSWFCLSLFIPSVIEGRKTSKILQKMFQIKLCL